MKKYPYPLVKKVSRGVPQVTPLYRAIEEECPLKAVDLHSCRVMNITFHIMASLLLVHNYINKFTPVIDYT